MSYGTAIVIFRADVAHKDIVVQWQAAFDQAAAQFPGFIESQVTSEDDPQRDWAVAVTFESLESLRQWLDSPRRHELAAQSEAAGVMTNATEVILEAGERPPPGVGVISHNVRKGQLAAFLAIQSEITKASGKFPGFLGMALLEAGPQRDQWLSLLRFDTPRHLNKWLKSKQRSELLPRLRASLDEDFTTYTRTTPFGSIVRVSGNTTLVTPWWRVVMLVMTVLYPIVMLLSRYLNPLLADIDLNPGAQLWISQIIGTSIMTVAVMPFMSWIFQKWLDPVDGKGKIISTIGFVAILILYAVEFYIFFTHTELQFWSQPK